MAYSNSRIHPLDRHFTLLLDSLQLDIFVDNYRGMISIDDDEVLYSPQSTRRNKIRYLVKVAKEKDPYLKNFLRALKNSDQSQHKELMEKLGSAMKQYSELTRETMPVDNDITQLTRSLSSLSSSSLDNRSRKVDVADDFTQVCCSGCTSPLNVIGDTADFMDVYNDANPHGFVHRYYKLKGISTKCRIKRDGTWHSEHSWFDGYWWMIINCNDCNLHWGWHFKNRDGSKGFYGIRTDAICLHAKK